MPNDEFIPGLDRDGDPVDVIDWCQFDNQPAGTVKKYR